MLDIRRVDLFAVVAVWGSHKMRAEHFASAFLDHKFHRREGKANTAFSPHGLNKFPLAASACMDWDFTTPERTTEVFRRSRGGFCWL